MMSLPNPPTEWSSAGEWASVYRACGLAPLPSTISTDGQRKHPLGAWKDFQDSGIPQAVHDRWYAPMTGTHQFANTMGSLTGRACFGPNHSLLVIDIDVKDGKRGLETWRGWLDVHNNGIEPETWTVRTGSGGLHLYFRYPRSHSIRNTQEKVEGIDVRAEGGFVVMPPSPHYLPGKEYVWLDGRAPWETEISDAPDWLIEEAQSLSEVSLARTQRIVVTDQPDRCEDVFGNTIDGRDKKMADIAYAAMLDAYRTCPIKPGLGDLEEVIQRSFASYLVHTETRLPKDGRTKEARLEDEGRGLTSFREKIARHYRGWDGYLAQAARNPPRHVIEERLADAQRGDTEALQILRTIAGWWGADGHPEASWLTLQLSGIRAEQQTGPATVNGSPSEKVPVGIPIRTAFPIDASKIPVRDWIIRGFLIRKHTSLLVAPGGSGKSLLTVQIAVALGAGRNWGGWTVDRPSKVLMVNAEDDGDEMDRRLYSAASRMRIGQAEVAGRVILASEPTDIVIARVDGKSKAVLRTEFVERLIKTIQDEEVDVCVVDPFAETFEGDENSNSDVKWVAAIWREIARRTGCAVLLVHHTKKYASGMSGDADAARGAGALVNSARIASTLFTMTEDEARTFGVKPEDRTRYVRFDDAKANMTLMSGSAKWFVKETVTLGNGDDQRQADDVGVLVPWKPPGALSGIALPTINHCLDAIDRGLLDDTGKPTGSLFTLHGNSKDKTRWVGSPIMSYFAYDEDQAKRVIREWKESGLLLEGEFADGKQTRKGVRIDNAKRPGEGDLVAL